MHDISTLTPYDGLAKLAVGYIALWMLGCLTSEASSTCMLLYAVLAFLVGSIWHAIVEIFHSAMGLRNNPREIIEIRKEIIESRKRRKEGEHTKSRDIGIKYIWICCLRFPMCTFFRGVGHLLCGRQDDENLEDYYRAYYTCLDNGRKEKLNITTLEASEAFYRNLSALFFCVGLILLMKCCCSPTMTHIESLACGFEALRNKTDYTMPCLVISYIFWCMRVYAQRKIYSLVWESEKYPLQIR